MTYTVHQFFKQFPDDDACLDHLMEARYGKELKCPKCRKDSKFHRLTGQPAYSCQFCGHHIHPMVGTPFESSRTSLQSWYYAIFLFTSSRHGVSAKELQRQLGVTYKCAWRMGHEIRKYMGRVDGDDPLEGHVEIDETFIGGKTTMDRKTKNKTVVLGMMERHGDVMTKVVPNARLKSVMPHIERNVVKGTEVSTDTWAAYESLRKRGYNHHAVNHTEKEYVRDDVHVNSLEGFWSMLKRSIQGTHVHVSRKHMPKYLAEFEYRYNLRKSPKVMFPRLMDDLAKVPPSAKRRKIKAC
jgi:transposase